MHVLPCHLRKVVSSRRPRGWKRGNAYRVRSSRSGRVEQIDNKHRLVPMQDPAPQSNLSLGRRVQVWLPPKDDVLAPGIFNEGTPGPRWFDFSSAPDMPGFDSSSCAADITWAGKRAFHMYQREIVPYYNTYKGRKEVSA